MCVCVCCVVLCVNMLTSFESESEYTHCKIVIAGFRIKHSFFEQVDKVCRGRGPLGLLSAVGFDLLTCVDK